MSDNTIFDDVFRTMLEKMPRLIIPVINEVFHTSYPEDAPIEQYRNEHHTKSGEIITDSYLGIGDMLYHIECQSTLDSRMCIRMIEYDFAIALERIERADDIFELNFPNSCVLFLRQNDSLPKELQVRVNLPDKTSFLYTVPAIRIQEYTKDDIFKKRLLFFLPFYIMRYEKKLKLIGSDPAKLTQLVSEFEDIRNRLRKELPKDEETDLYTRLIELIGRITDYILETESMLKERIGDVMGGKVLELETDKILKQGIEQGIEKGIEKVIENMLKDKEDETKIVLYTGCTYDDILRVKEQLENTHILSDNTLPHRPPKSR